MTLKLFTPAELRDVKETERVRDIMRIKTTREALDKIRTELNEANALFDKKLAQNQVEWLKEQEKAHVILAQLNEEIEVKRKEREQLLIPIEIERNKAHDLFEQAEIVLRESKAQAELNETNALLLQDKIDDYSEKEQDLDSREKRIIAKEMAIEDQNRISKELSEKTILQMQSFLSDMEMKRKEMDNLKKSLNLQDSSIRARERSLVIKEKALGEEKELIRSQRGALKAALELKK